MVVAAMLSVSPGSARVCVIVCVLVLRHRIPTTDVDGGTFRTRAVLCQPDRHRRTGGTLSWGSAMLRCQPRTCQETGRCCCPRPPPGPMDVLETFQGQVVRNVRGSAAPSSARTCVCVCVCVCVRACVSRTTSFPQLCNYARSQCARLGPMGCTPSGRMATPVAHLAQTRNVCSTLLPVFPSPQRSAAHPRARPATVTAVMYAVATQHLNHRRVANRRRAPSAVSS